MLGAAMPACESKTEFRVNLGDILNRVELGLLSKRIGLRSFINRP